MRTMLTPAPPLTHTLILAGVLLLLALSAVLILVAPVMMPDSYSWVSNYISESAAQNVTDAWVARLGFLLFGFAVLWLSISLRSTWARGAYWGHLGFGLFMISTAAFSHRPWLEAVPFDAFEDVLHSFTATGMGFAFSIGVLMRLLQRQSQEETTRVLDLLAITLAVGLPPLGGVWPSIAGVTQRLLFLVAYVWYGNEAIKAHREPTRLRAAAYR